LYKDKPFAAVRERVTAVCGVVENTRILCGQYTEFSFRLMPVVKIVTTVLYRVRGRNCMFTCLSVIGRWVRIVY